MNVYKTDKIRNVVLLGHGGAGKTTIAEAMAHLTGITSRMGNITDGNTISDYDKEEIKRKFSISTTVVPVEYNKVKINVLDTPGYFDFVGEVEEAAGVADAAVIVISGKDGVQVGTEKAWELCEKNNLPRCFFVTNMDNGDVSYRALIESLQDLYGAKISPLALPVHIGGKFAGFADVVSQEAFKFVGKDQHQAIDMPDETAEQVEEYREALMENVAETSEEFMERYFGGDEFTADEINEAISVGVADASIVPVFLGSTTSLQGITNLMNNIIALFPDPSKLTATGKAQKTDSDFEANYDDSKEKTAYVWKSIADPFIGKYSFIKVMSGVLKSDDTMYDIQKESELRIGKLYVMRGNKGQEVPELHAGDIGALAKLGDVNTGDSLSSKANPILFAPTELSVPYTCKRYRAVKKGEEDKIATSLAKLNQEDHTFRIKNDSANHQSLIYGIGEQQLEVVKSKLKERYKVDVELLTPKVAFRETIRKNSDVDSKYKKQTGGHGQYGHVKMRFEPSGDQSKPYEFAIEVVGGSVPKNYYPAVEKGLVESVSAGPLAAYPVVGVKATLYDGSYHPVDSSEQAFKTATRQAFKEGFLKAGPVLLEPIVSLKVKVRDKFTGDVMGDLNKRRGRVLGMNPDHKGNTIIEADVPEKEMDGYGTILRSMTGGQGEFAYEFARYEQAPADVQEKEIKDRADQLNESED
ncbi:MAG: elongation factor G [Lachnospiraceae bacterium]|nr:elongation factor G [Lachnospiraceae bacterium]